MILSVPKHFFSSSTMHGTYKRHSAFDHTLNFIRDDALISVHDKDRTLSPLGIRLNVTSQEFQNLKQSLKSVTIDGEGVSMGKEKVSYQSVILIDHDLKKQVKTKGAITDAMRYSLYHETKKKMAAYEAKMDTLSRKAVDARLLALKEALSASALEEKVLDDTIQALIGLGPGLTPSGDDILAGLVAGLLMQEDHSLLQLIVPMIQKGINTPNQTSMVSRQFLFYATQGIFIGEILMLHHRLLLSRSIDQSLDKIASMGHSSGVDYLKGLTLAISIGGINHGS